MGYKQVFVCDACGREAPKPTNWWSLKQGTALSLVFCTSECLGKYAERKGAD
ncbi:hypothetical protein LCGC14_2597420 [marine sediment metagenome]|uniref:Uncharacterized protein n=1 Tax=marine sediment metagenome TaxID=412755 RepID=A0A0F9D2J0_9ZZZZ